MSIPVMSEKQMQTALVRAAKQLGYLCYHTQHALGSQPGFPDLVIVGKGRLWFMELKGPKGRVSDVQEQWITELTNSGVSAQIVWPQDYDQVMRELMDAYEEAA